MDVSTSMSKLKPKESDAYPKPAGLSFWDERARLEWPRRRTPPSRGVKETPKRGEDKSEAKEEKGWREQASWGSFPDMSGQGQPACRRV